MLRRAHSSSVTISSYSTSGVHCVFPIVPSCCLFQLTVFCASCAHWKPTGVADSHCILWYQTQLILTACQIRYQSHLWGHCRTGQLWAFIPRSYLKHPPMSRPRQLILVCPPPPPQSKQPVSSCAHNSACSLTRVAPRGCVLCQKWLHALESIYCDLDGLHGSRGNWKSSTKKFVQTVPLFLKQICIWCKAANLCHLEEEVLHPNFLKKIFCERNRTCVVVPCCCFALLMPATTRGAAVVFQEHGLAWIACAARYPRPPHSCPSRWGGVHFVNLKISLWVSVLSCRTVCCEALPLVSLVLWQDFRKYFL